MTASTRPLKGVNDKNDYLMELLTWSFHDWGTRCVKRNVQHSVPQWIISTHRAQ